MKHFGTVIEQVLKWFDEKRCSHKFGRNSNPLVPLCKNPRPREKNFKIHIDFHDVRREPHQAVPLRDAGCEGRAS